MEKLLVKKMTCRHCEAKIKDTLTKNKIEFTIDLDQQIVEVEKEKVSIVINILGKIGYPAEVI